LKTKGGLDYLSFDDLYNKLRALELDIKGHSSYAAPPSHSAFISTNSNRVSHSPSPSPSTTTLSFTTTGPKSYPQTSNVMKDVLHSFVTEFDQEQQQAYEDFE
jgi:hypothetical protein